jgi:hypothetical protein
MFQILPLGSIWRSDQRSAALSTFKVWLVHFGSWDVPMGDYDYLTTNISFVI